MRFLKSLFKFVAVLVIILVVGAFFLPREVSVVRSVDISAPADKIFPHVNSLQAATGWSPWLELDPNVQNTFEGPDSGVGNKMSWTSEVDQVGSGSQIITESEQDTMVATDLDFGDMGLAKAKVLLTEAGGTTNVTWAFATDMGNNPVSRWMGLMMDSWVGADYEKGLAKLKTLVEDS